MTPTQAGGRRGLRQDADGAIALVVGMSAAALIGLAALVVDSGFWILGQTRLQIAADAGAMGAGFLLGNANLKTQSATVQASTYQAVALSEAQGAVGTKLIGTMNTPLTVVVAADYSTVQVTVTSVAQAYFAGIFKSTAPTLRATATATLKSTPATPCVLTLSKVGTGIKVDNSGTVSAANCGIFSKSNDSDKTVPSIYLNSGTISATSVAASGSVTQSNSGSNSMTPSNPTSNSPTVYNDPNAGLTAPTPNSTCNSTNNYTAYSANPYALTPTTWCGNVTIGGNSSTATFAPGVYIINNGNLTFNNASITQAANVTFVLTGTSPGSFSWTNYSNTSTQITAPTTGSTAGIAIWQVCNSAGGQTSSFQGGSTLVVSGTMYMPCSNVDVGNNAQLSAPLNSPFSMIANTLYTHGSAAVRTAASNSSTASSGSVVLSQ